MIGPKRRQRGSSSILTIVLFIEDTQLPGLRQEFRELPAGGSGYDLSLMLGVGDKGVTGRFEYARALFSQSTIERIAKSYIHLLEAVADTPDSRLKALRISRL